MRLSGTYRIRNEPIHQSDFQIQPSKFIEFDGWKIPVGGPFSLVKSERGSIILYVSCPGETPLYYAAQPQVLYWSEQKYDLPKSSRRVNPGELIIWEPGYITPSVVDYFPKPNIQEDYPLIEAYRQYAQLLQDAIARRLATCPNPSRVAVAQSGGLDSLLVTWALLQHGVEVIPITVCAGPDDLDITAASACLETWGLKPIPVMITQSEIEQLLRESLRCNEDTETSNLRMGMGNILMARQCQLMKVETIFTGHGHDDIHGKGTLVKQALAKAQGQSESERWANTRRSVTLATGGMLKMFASTFRSYGVRVRLPYYDRELLGWAFNQPTSIIPVTFDKSFVRGFANHVLPFGAWLDKKHSVGYLTGAGISLKQRLLQGNSLFSPQFLTQQLKAIKHENSISTPNPA
ncbi:MAG: hypothetical protein ICV85_17850 [Tolypothrix sp. T3-bin4]|nr:hypothetical protein [Tolypothrix sp. T3-bin4]